MANNITNVWKLMGIDPATGTGTYKNRMGLGNAITRDNGIPLDLSSLHATYNDAVVYAATSSIAYVDQPIAAEGVLYLITETSQGKAKISSYRDSITGKLITGEEKEYDVYLKRVGIVPSGDNASVVVNGEGLIKLFAFDGAQAGAVPVKEDGKLVWKTLEEIGAGDGNDNTTYEFALNDAKTGIVITPLFNGQPIMEGEEGAQTQVKYTLDLDVYTKEEVDDAISEAVSGAIEGILGTTEDTADKNTIYGAKAAAQSAKEDVNALRGESSDDESKVTVYGAIAKANSAHEGILRLHGLSNDTSETSSIKGAKLYTDEKVAALNIGDYAKTADVNSALADKADKTALESLQDTVDAFLTGDGTEAALDSLKELIAYIDSHDDVDIAGILEDIQAIEDKLELGTYVDGEETKEYATVKAYVEAAIAALKIGDYAKASDLSDLADRVATIEAKPFDTYATKAELEAHAETAENTYATKAELEAHEEAAAEAYATKDELSAHEEAAADTYATKDELSAHEEAAADTYATKDELSALEESVAGTYATKGELKDTDDVAKDAQNRVGIVEGKIDEITSVGGEPNVIEKIKVNGVTLEVEKDAEGKSTKTVSISVPTSITTLDGYSELNQKVVNNTNASTKNANDISALQGQLGTTNTNVSGLTERLAALEAEVGESEKSRIDALEGVTAQHTTDIGANTTAITTLNTSTIPALQLAIENEAKARQEADKAITDLIGTVESGKTVVDMINAVAGTIDFSPYAKTEDVAKTYATIASVEAIYKAGEGEAAATGLLADEIARAKAAEKDLDDAIKLLTDGAGTDEIDSVKELIDYVNAHGATVEGINNRLDGHDDILAGIGGENQPATVLAAIQAAAYVLPQATADVLGGVKSAKDVVNGETTSVAVNKVYVGEDGVGEVKAFSTDNLVQGSMTLVLNGGNAEVSAS